MTTTATAPVKTKSPAPFVGNPLVKFRAPQNMRRKDIRNGQFIVRRGDVINGDGTLEIYPDDFRYKKSPHLELDFKLWEDYGDDSRSVSNYVRLMGRGYQLASTDNFDINPAIAMLWKDDTTKRITYAGKMKGYVLMWAPGSVYDANAAKALKHSNDVQQHAAGQTARLQEQWSRTGYDVQAEVKIEDEVVAQA